MAQLCATHPAFKAPGLAAGRLSINEQTKPFGMAERGGTILRFQLSEGGDVVSAIPSNFRALS